MMCAILFSAAGGNSLPVAESSLKRRTDLIASRPLYRIDPEQSIPLFLIAEMVEEVRQ